MKYYSYDIIKDFYDSHRDEINALYLDWSLTCSKFGSGSNHQIINGGQYLYVRGIPGSTWATPVMKVVYKNGLEEILPCYFDDGEKVSEEEIASCKTFVKAAMGGDSVYD